MNVSRISYKIVYICLCISAIFLFLHITSTSVDKNSELTKNLYENTTNREPYDVGLMSPDHLLGLMPKKINEFVEQHLDEELIVNEFISYYEYRELLEYLKMLQRVLYQMLIYLVTLICIHTTGRRTINYIYDKDGPKRNIPLVTIF